MENSYFTTKNDFENEKSKLYKAISMPGKSKMPTSKIVKNIISILIIIFLVATLLSIVITKVSGDVPNIFGVYLFQVETESMEPTLDVGKVIVAVKPSSEDSVNVGDIITFKTTSGKVVTHRIVDKIDGEFLTKGDNPINSVDTERVTFKRIIAVMKFKL
ncbi:MAG: signal peptidase I [Clostridia bacterium]